LGRQKVGLAVLVIFVNSSSEIKYALPSESSSDKQKEAVRKVSHLRETWDNFVLLFKDQPQLGYGYICDHLPKDTTVDTIKEMLQDVQCMQRVWRGQIAVPGNECWMFKCERDQKFLECHVELVQLQEKELAKLRERFSWVFATDSVSVMRRKKERRTSGSSGGRATSAAGRASAAERLRLFVSQALGVKHVMTLQQLRDELSSNCTPPPSRHWHTADAKAAMEASAGLFEEAVAAVAARVGDHVVVKSVDPSTDKVITAFDGSDGAVSKRNLGRLSLTQKLPVCWRCERDQSGGWGGLASGCFSKNYGGGCGGKRGDVDVQGFLVMESFMHFMRHIFFVIVNYCKSASIGRALPQDRIVKLLEVSQRKSCSTSKHFSLCPAIASVMAWNLILQLRSFSACLCRASEWWRTPWFHDDAAIHCWGYTRRVRHYVKKLS
jgi:hypothetical protein